VPHSMFTYVSLDVERRRSNVVDFQSSEFPNRNNFLIVLLVKPSDAECLEYQKPAAIRPG
jgi:hypothetical protein